MKELVKKANEVANALVSTDFVRVISHKDADGITSAATLCTALKREKIPFHATIVSRPSTELAGKLNEEENETIIFFDMGSGQPDVIKEIDKKVLVVDHHPPEYKDGVSHLHLNPHHHGVDGASEVSAAGLSYLIAREINNKNKDLSCIALAGAIGDRQHLPLIGVNSELVNDGVEVGAIEIEEGLRLYGETTKALQTSTDPYFKNLRNIENIEQLLNRLDIPIEKDINELTKKHKTKLIKTLSLMLLKQGATAKTITSMVGEIYRINRGPVKYATELTSLINACTRKEKYGMALSIALNDKKHVTDAQEYEKEFNQKILDELYSVEEKINEYRCVNTIDVETKSIKGAVASIAVNCLIPEKPLLSLYKGTDEIKISARGNEDLIKKGLNLSKAMSVSADIVGGRGGGHNIASGASIPIDSLNIFLDKINEILCDQLGDTNE
ncbi:Single-stranded DNA-specific exonuclease RecJ [Methanonatronarchaeum thermophilum]|uniref:Single-stranded DNA-specific exonuclease RecJ n=1 Tax=Methanonatronarchaeum thermophilum TaxID=1927129 RepID=A0A1Y3GAZ8_9EURY|nr:DHH family phosphoesterase [Methanonatronarchaeum thermophilum]OUJ18632.1 Single-stranded DNA-specific exonuclease RecJ [Methanonatronarchaeum thermophilum]